MNKEEYENKMNKITKELLNEEKIDKENFTKNFLMKKTNAKDIVLSMGINPGREEKQYKANEKVNDYIYFWNTKNLTKKEKHDLKVFNDYYVFKHSYHSENYKIFSKLDAKAHWGQEDYLSEDEIKKMLKNCGKDLKENYVKRIVEIIRKMHQKAGSKNVYELHGSIYRNYCMKCHKSYNAEYVFNSKDIPRCTCGGIIKPDVVLYEEGLDENIYENAIISIQKADMLIVGGTSLTVYPASLLINYFKGNKLVLINKDATSFDNKADLVINESLGNVFKKLK